MAEIISQREFGRRLGVSETTIRKAIGNSWIDKGKTTTASGRPAIDYEIALEEWNNSPAGLQAAEKNIGKPASSYIPKKQQTIETTSNVGASTNQIKAPIFDPEAAASKKKILENKTNSSTIRTQREAFEFQKQLGKFVDKDKVYADLYEFGKALRDNLMNVPERVIDDILLAPDRTGAITILENSLIEALRGLSQPPDLTKY